MFLKHCLIDSLRSSRVKIKNYVRADDDAVSRAFPSKGKMAADGTEEEEMTDPT